MNRPAPGVFPGPASMSDVRPRRAVDLRLCFTPPCEGTDLAPSVRQLRERYVAVASSVSQVPPGEYVVTAVRCCRRPAPALPGLRRRDDFAPGRRDLLGVRGLR